MNAVATPMEERFAQIDALDFTLLKRKLTHPVQGEGWSSESAERVEAEYKRYLKITLKYPDERVSPSIDVDKFWHAHILDTQRYVEDCQSIFGYFLHHYPYAGMNGDEDAQHEAAGKMDAIYEREFGKAVQHGAALCWTARPGANSGAALCWAARPGTKSDAALCWAAKPGTKLDAALCWAAKPAAHQFKAAVC